MLMSTDTSQTNGTSIQPQPRILIFGTGSVGAVYAFLLARAGCHTTVICRSNYEAVKVNGLTIASALFGTHTFRPDLVADSISSALSEQGTFAESYDYIIVTSKSFPGSTPTQASLLAPAVTLFQTTIILIQNGIAIEPEYSQLYPQNPLLSCVVYLPVTQISPGHFAHKEVEKLEIGTYPSIAAPAHKESASRFTDLIVGAGATATLHDDVQLERWRKLVVNASWNPICALSQCRDAEFLASTPGGSALSYIRTVMLEIASIAQASGYSSIDEGVVDFQLSRAQARTLEKAVEPSMMADALSGRRMEVEAIVGNAVRIAEERGIGDKVPLLRGIYVMVRGLDTPKWRGSGTVN